jgi:hypothetical protein
MTDREECVYMAKLAEQVRRAPPRQGRPQITRAARGRKRRLVSGF